MKKLLVVLVLLAALALVSCSKEDIPVVENTETEQIEVNLYEELSESFEGIKEYRVLGNVNGIDQVEKVYYEFVDESYIKISTPIPNNKDCFDDGEGFLILEIDFVENDNNYFKFTFGDNYEIRGYRIHGDISVNGTINDAYEEHGYKLTNSLPSDCN